MCILDKYRCVVRLVSLIIPGVLMFLTYLFFLILDKRFCKLLRTAAIWPGTKCSDRSNRIGSTEWKNGIFIL